jgi:hypothetical protein
LRRQPILAHGHQSEQPGILVLRGMDSDDRWAIDVDPAEDLPEGLFA